MMTDRIADLLTRIRNGIRAKHEEVIIPSSKMKLSIVKILKEEGYIKDYSEEKDERGHPCIKVVLKYDSEGNSVISGLKRLSKPGRRLYEKAASLPKSLGGYGIVLVSTSKGIMTDKKCREENLGGEILCEIW
ncbi:MAG: 30S ribosomal protein S8 [Candidatus Schekmanbacteria bacterium]|nr:MAG: 30S ribosomal protein S8 [Candidatus Schekmanbacteria bacterium]